MNNQTPEAKTQKRYVHCESYGCKNHPSKTVTDLKTGKSKRMCGKCAEEVCYR